MPKHSLPLRVTTFLVTQHPIKAIITSFVPALISLIIVLTTNSIQLSTPVLADYYIRNNEITKAFETRAAARLFFNIPHAPSIIKNSTRIHPSLHFSVMLVFRTISKQENILTAENIAAMKRAEDVILSHQSYPRFCFHNPHGRSCEAENVPPVCALPASPTMSPHFFGVLSPKRYICARRNGSSIPVARNVSAFLKELQNENSTYAPMLGSSAKNGSTWIASSKIAIGTPFEGYADDSDRKSEQFEEYREWMRSLMEPVTMAAKPQLDVYMLGLQIGTMRFRDAVMEDLVYCGAAFVLVTILLIVHTQSVFLATIAIAQVALAFPLALLIYTHIFRLLYFSVLHIFAIYLLVGIAADDVFVFTDSWKQAPIVLNECTLYDRVAWTYSRAVKAITVTSVTTAVAFFTMSASPIMPISTSTLWAGLLILTQFSLVITAYPCALVIQHRYLQEWCCFKCFTKLDRLSAGMEVDTPNTDTSTIDSPDEEPGSIGLFKKSINRMKKIFSRSDTSEYRMLERWFNGTWTKGLNRMRYVLVVVAMVWLIAAIGFVTQLRPLDALESTTAQLPDGRLAEQQVQSEFVSSNDSAFITVNMLWGIAGVNRSGSSYYLREDIGTPVIDKTFDLKTKAAQYLMLNMCRSLENDSMFVNMLMPRENRVRCWLEDFLHWRAEEQNKEGFEEYKNEHSLLIDVLSFGAFVDRDRKQPYMKYLTGKDLLISKDFRRLVASEIRYKTPTKRRSTPLELRTLYRRWRAVNYIGNEAAPASANKALMTGGHPWVFEVAQSALIGSMVIGIVIMIGITALILILTVQSIRASILATVALSGILSSILAFVYLLGWRLGISESLIAVVSVGYSFDGIAHITNAYIESKSESRLERTRDALTALGISIVFGSLSTAVSSAMLLFAQVLVLRRLGILIVMTMGLTAVWSLVFLPAALIVIGPKQKNASLQKAIQFVCSFPLRKCVGSPTDREDAELPQVEKNVRFNDGQTGEQT